LYSRFGFRAPFIFGEICTLVDLLLRLLIIERDVAIKWGYDPATGRDISATTDLEASSTDDRSDATGPSQSRLIPLHSSSEQTPASVDPKEVQSAVDSCAPAANNSTVSPVHKSLPILSIIWQIAKSSRARVALMVTLVSGILLSMEDPTLPLRLQSLWGYNSEQVGLVFIACLVPTLISSPLTGFLSDVIGSGYTMSISILLGIPWSAILVLKKSVALFIVALAFESFFLSGLGPPVDAELAAISRGLPDVGYAHVYGAFNLISGIGSIVGSLMGGQVYSHIKDGWSVLCYLTVGCFGMCLPLVFCYTGEDPPLSKILRRKNRLQESPVQEPTEKERPANDSAVHAA